MTTHCIREEIAKARIGEENSILSLIERFDPLLQKYARVLRYDDAYSDIQLNFIIIMSAFPPCENFVNDGAVVSYIQKALFHACLHLKRKQAEGRTVVYYNELSEDQLDILEKENGVEDDYSNIYVESIRPLLTNTEFMVLYRHYVHHLSIAAIAEQDNIARQTVNRTKNRALDKLKKKYLSQ